MVADPDPEPEALPVLPDPVPTDAERALARFGLLGEGAAPAFTPGARYPLAGLLLALPPLAQSGLLDRARQVYGRLRNGFYGLEVTLVTGVFLALLREARAEGATRIPPDALGRVLGLDRAPEVKTIRLKAGELAAAGKAAELQLALARHHAAASPGTLGFMYIDGHTRAYFGKRDIQRCTCQAQVPRPGDGGDLGHRQRRGPAAGRDGPAVIFPGRPDPRAAARAARHRRPGAKPTCALTGAAGPRRRRGITDAGFDLLTYRKNDTCKDIPDLPGDRVRPRPAAPATTAAARLRPRLYHTDLTHQRRRA